MKTLYLECRMGAAGDMLAAALLELHGDPEGFLGRLNALGIPGVCVKSAPSVKCGITGTRFTVTVDGHEEHDHGHSHEHPHEHTHGHPHEHPHEHSHGHIRDIEALIHGLGISETVKENALAVYGLLAAAEGHVHGVPVTQIHFHEVGTMDAVADIVGVCMLMEELAPERVVVSPVHVGSGTVRCAHGVLPVPAPAAAFLLRDVPVYGGTVAGELCTPTGAALLAHFADAFGPMPEMCGTQIGYGMGKKDFEAANCVRAFLGNSATGSEGGPNGQAAELRCNIDDMTGEALGYACRLLLREGALDVLVTPAQMKKDRPGQLLTVLCEPAEADRLAGVMLRATTTFGVRKTLCERYTLEREILEAETPYGIIRVKTGIGYGAEKAKPEYEDVAAAAERCGVPPALVEDSAREWLKANRKGKRS